MKLPTFLAFGVFAVCLLSPMAGLAVPPPESQVQAIEAPQRFGFADVRRRAESLAHQDFAESGNDLPDYLRNLSYDQYRDIRFRPENALWRDEGLPFALRFFHRGFLYTRKVIVNVVQNGQVMALAYNPLMFNFGANQVPAQMPEDLGFAGFQVFYPLREDKTYDEVSVFLGASYFRAVGLGQTYGISARGLAIDTGLASGEEFPFFREFWIEKPDKDTTALTVYALLDSQSVTGAYRFVIQPGTENVVEVKGTVFFRKAVQRLGIAPLTSMYSHGENSGRFFDDFRPEVHDSDGLFMVNGANERLWRPLRNPLTLRINSFSDQNPIGFGLLQRDRDFEHYQDLEAHYHLRPSAWVEPVGEWGKGVVQLVEIPTDSEYNDNIVAFWVPDRATKAGDELSFEYRLRFALDQLEQKLGAGKILSTRVGGLGKLTPEVRRFVLEFTGPALESLTPETHVEAKVWTSAGTLQHVMSAYNPHTKGRRAVFDLMPPDDNNPVVLRCYLRQGENVLSETWNYEWNRK